MLADIRLLVCFLVAHTVLDSYGENQTPFRHDISTVVTVNKPISPDLAKKLKKKNPNFCDYYERTVSSCKGVFKAALSPDHGISEWDGYAYLMLIINQTNDVQLLVSGADNKYRVAPYSQPGLLTDTTLFLGPPNAGICFYYQVIKDELRTIVSPLGLQKLIKFQRVLGEDIVDKPIARVEKEAGKIDNKTPPAVTNYLWYLNKEEVVDKETLRELHDEKMRGVFGTYIFEDENFFNKWYAVNVDKWYLVINSETDVAWIEEVNGRLFFELDSRPGSINEMFMRFGGPFDGTSLLYKHDGDSLSVFLNYGMGFHDNDAVLNARFSELEARGLFQRKLIFRKTAPIPPDRYPTRSRTPGEYFFGYQSKGGRSENKK